MSFCFHIHATVPGSSRSGGFFLKLVKNEGLVCKGLVNPLILGGMFGIWFAKNVRNFKALP